LAVFAYRLAVFPRRLVVIVYSLAVFVYHLAVFPRRLAVFVCRLAVFVYRLAVFPRRFGDNGVSDTAFLHDAI
jgi:uncharacterized membrane protein YhaH (DUF805 family)